MKGKVFLDSNLWVYLNSSEAKAPVVRELVTKHFTDIVISTQVLGETYNVLVKKRFTNQETAQDIVSDLQDSFTISPITSTTVSHAMEINSRHGYSYWDSLIIASAMETGCVTLFSEDLHHSQLLDKKLTIVNPFA
jgi:predicted nucleic acid-binding protein